MLLGRREIQDIGDSKTSPAKTGLLVLCACAGVAGVGYINRITGTGISFSIFYLLPVSFASWFIGLWPGLAIAFLSAGAWLTADLAAGIPYGHLLVPYWNMALRALLFVVAAVLLNKLRKTLAREKEWAYQDHMTGVGNGRFFALVGARELMRCARFHLPLSMAYIDLDNFKSVNDRWGHQAGDAVLISAASAMKNNVRGIDFVARLGGDEFVILMPDTDEEGAFTVVSRVHEVLRQSAAEEGWPVSYSIGLVTFLDPPGSIEELVKAADDLMYRAKREGKDRIAPATVAGGAE
jgi:diguanylate cyclase (GGDEF)-like protein